ncbi:hypothetical protein FRC16_011113 [Serendipita sp. 398]|nr:hypothetical protein FRC16_011113 [Serendipita sp. 398]
MAFSLSIFHHTNALVWFMNVSHDYFKVRWRVVSIVFDHSNMSLTNLEDVVTAATTVTDSAVLANALRNFLKRDVAEHLLASSLPDDVDPLAILNPTTNTLGYLYVLTARLEQPGAAIQLAPQIYAFCEGCSSTPLAYVSERVNTFVNRLMRQPNLPELLEALAKFVQRYPHKRDVFTMVHMVFLHACVVTRQYQVALPVLSVPMGSIDKTIYPINYLDNLLYHYFGAFVYIALKRWPQAEEFLEMVVAAPIASSIPSAIQMEAMKKLALVQLIRHGTLKSLPRYVPQMFTKSIKQSPYGQLAKAYPAGNLIQIAEKEAKVFTQDFNFGLLREVLDHAPRWKLRTLTKTYLTLSMSEIGKEIGMEDGKVLRALVEDMIRVGEITAILENDTLTFIDEKPDFRPEDVEKALAEAQRQCERLALLDQQIGRSKEFLQKALKERDSGGGGAWAGHGGMDEELLWAEDLQGEGYV